MNNSKGNWTAAEDTVLTAAIRKYGLFQWSRISSLLPRKTPSQCKARWFNYMNPNLLKAQWSTNEDVRLVHLVKTRPNQWASIGQTLNRSVDDCVKRYRQLMAENVTGDDIEIDTSAAESKPASGSNNMEEFEHEMISEAQSRLAMNQGKKPQRKARERAQAQAKQLADIQRKRELEQLGHKVKQKKKAKINGIDYNAEIPFEHRPPTGPYDTNIEDQIAQKDKANWQKNIKGISLAAADLFTGSRYAIGGARKRKGDTNQQKANKKHKSEKMRGSDIGDDGNEVTEELKRRPKFSFTTHSEPNDKGSDLADNLLQLNSREREKSILLSKKTELIEFQKTKSVVKNERNKEKSLHKKLKNLFDLLDNIEDDNDIAPSMTEFDVYSSDSEDRKETTKLTREQIREVLEPQALKMGLPTPNPYVGLNSDKRTAFDNEFQMLVSTPELQDLDDFDMMAYQQIANQIEDCVFSGSEHPATTKSVTLNKSQLVEIIMKYTQKSTEIDTEVASNMHSWAPSVQAPPYKSINELKDMLWVQKNVNKVDKQNSKKREQSLQNNIDMINRMFN